MEAAVDEWSPLESDSGVFRELLRENGVRGVDVADVYDTDTFADDCAARGTLVLGYVLLLDKGRHQHTMEPTDTATSAAAATAAPDEPLWFARQIVNNACATHALLSVVMNLDRVTATLRAAAAAETATASATDASATAGLDAVALGEPLAAFRAFTTGFDAQMRGLAVGNSAALRRAHNSFRNEARELLCAGARDDPRRAAHTDDPRTRLYHFVTYVVVRTAAGAYDACELDGLYNAAPVRVLRADSYGAAHRGLLAFLAQRLHALGTRDLFFALMALVTDAQPVLQQRLAAAAAAGDTAACALVQDELDALARRRAAQDRENARRRHNCLPLVLGLLERLAQNGSLAMLVESRKGASTD